MWSSGWCNLQAAHDLNHHQSIDPGPSRQQSRTRYLDSPISVLFRHPRRPNNRMLNQSTTTTPARGSIKLSYARPLPDEQVQALEEAIRQAGLDIQECRRYTDEQPDRIDHVVEIIAVYDQLTSDEWSDLLGLVVQTFCEPPSLGNNVWAARKTM